MVVEAMIIFDFLGRMCTVTRKEGDKGLPHFTSRGMEASEGGRWGEGSR